MSESLNLVADLGAMLSAAVFAVPVLRTAVYQHRMRRLRSVVHTVVDPTGLALGNTLVELLRQALAAGRAADVRLYQAGSLLLGVALLIKAALAGATLGSG